ncbi:fimbrial protein [Pantoea sp. 1.19]|uniref:fimbrial protein n=1 Tax=Pantoea sp. 1.19 TaxID=1925589 RepID=UPI0009491EED|nr:fimbrial protein [Pantoea sp. 1.19]
MKRSVWGYVCALLLGSDICPAAAFVCSTTTASTTLSPPNITVQRDLPVGSVIGSQIMTGSVPAFSCVNSAPTLTYQQTGIKAYGSFITTINGQRIYSTNIAGIGYAVGVRMVENCIKSTQWVDGSNNVDGNLNNRIACSTNGSFDKPYINMQAVISFYKTAAVTGSGTVNGKTVAAFILRNNQNAWFSPESRVTISGFNVTTLACTVSNTAISVPMGTVEKRAFGGPGSWPGDDNTKRFSIPLVCNPGTRVNVQIDGSTQNAAQGILTLTGSSGSASGVGIQLLYNNAPLTLGTPFFTGTSATQGSYAIPLQARYYQTASEVGVGVANSSATFTLTYQ